MMNSVQNMEVSAEAVSPFSAISMVPEDPMFALSAAFHADEHSKKVDLGVGAYRDEQGNPWILPSVQSAKARLLAQTELNHEYLPIAGHAEFLEGSAKLIFGEDSPVLTESRVAVLQTLSGTGALHLGAALLAQFSPATKKVYLSSPPYINHAPIFNHVGIEDERYPYYKSATRGFDLDGMLAELRAIPDGSLILLHACAHNPTGVDPTHDDWKRISGVVKDKRHVPFFDIAYQGFSSGDPDEDAWVMRYFVSQGHANMLIAQSYAKNFGLYGERVGCLHVVVPSSDVAQRVMGQAKTIQRREVSTPPLHGALIIVTILSEKKLLEQWKDDVRYIADRLKRMRAKLRDLLETESESPATWRHLTDQIGMFCYTGLTERQVALLREKHHIFMSNDGRISVAGLNDGNVERTAQAILSVSHTTSVL